MRPITFSVDGDPVPQPRPRVTMRGGFGHAYVPKGHKVHAYRQMLALAAKAAGLQATPHPLQVIVDAVFARPKSHLLKSGVKSTAPKHPRVDVDNIAKAVLDAIGPIVGNDSQVVRLVVEKSYGTEARTTVRIQ